MNRFITAGIWFAISIQTNARNRVKDPREFECSSMALPRASIDHRKWKKDPRAAMARCKGFGE
jgi:hypothetical protein